VTRFLATYKSYIAIKAHFSHTC